MSNHRAWGVLLLCTGSICQAENSKPFDPAAAFGARQSVSGVHLSPDGTSIAYIAPGPGQGAVAYTLSLAKGSAPKPAMSADGKPYRLENCHWVSNERLSCLIYAVINDAAIGRVGMSRTIAVDVGGKNVQVLSTRESTYTRGIAFGGR